MSSGDKMRTIVAAKAKAPTTLALKWSDGTRADVDLQTMLRDRRLRALRESSEFARVHVGAWGHSLEWPSGVELGADALWLETLSATGHEDARIFLEWRLGHGLSLAKAADALGLSRRMVAYYYPES
ncbi:MAG: DUF2442 domain-containing protein [Rhodospirillales bacterium]|nr:DUF2442 domain-containing protein [Rhodospirillales bacterium]